VESYRLATAQPRRRDKSSCTVSSFTINGGSSKALGVSAHGGPRPAKISSCARADGGPISASTTESSAPISEPRCDPRRVRPGVKMPQPEAVPDFPAGTGTAVCPTRGSLGPSTKHWGRPPWRCCGDGRPSFVQQCKLRGHGRGGEDPRWRGRGQTRSHSNFRKSPAEDGVRAMPARLASPDSPRAGRSRIKDDPGSADAALAV
jgi:hypothetical protein